MPFWDRLSGQKRWAAGGAISEPSDAQANQGFAYLPNGKPTVEGFNALFQGLDDKDNWLFRQWRGVLQRAGMTPVEAGDNQLADALRRLLAASPVVFTTAGTASHVVGAQTAHVLVAVTGGGGGANGGNSTRRSGAGGGAGGTAIGIYAVTPGAAVSVTVGDGGAGGAATGANGGSSSFGGFCAATGGSGGGRVDTANLDGGLGGLGSGGLFNLKGADGGDGHRETTTSLGTGYGGAAFLGSSRRGTKTGASAGQNGANPGDGGSASYYDGASTANGGRGAAGRVIVWPLA